FAIPFGVDPVDGVLEHGGGTVVVFGGDEDEAVGEPNRRGPFPHDLVLVRGASRCGWRCGLIEERHWIVAKSKEERVAAIPLLQVLQDPARRLFREPALAGAADDD